MNHYYNRIGEIWKLGLRVELIIDCHVKKSYYSAKYEVNWKTVVLSNDENGDLFQIGKFHHVSETALMIAESERPQWHQIYATWYKVI
jgi:hypothetical protein